MIFLKTLASWAALLAGVLLTFITLVTCGLLIARNFFGFSLGGDYEITKVAAGAAIALFLPWCQFRRGNIIVDFFTAKASDQTNQRLDKFGALILAMVMFILAWRSGLGGWNAYTSHTETQDLGIPEWWVYAAIVPSFLLTGLIGMVQFVQGFDDVEAQEVKA